MLRIRDVERARSAPIIALRRDQGLAILSSPGCAATGISIQETENVAGGDEDNPVGRRSAMVEFLGSQKLER